MKIERIYDKEDTRLDIYYRYKEEQLAKRGVFIGESPLIIERAMDAHYEVISFLIREKQESRFLDIFQRVKNDFVIYEVSEEVFLQLKGYVLTRDILTCFKRKEESSFKDVIEDKKRIVVLEGVVNPTNIGAIFRNALAFHVNGILLSKECCDPLSRRSIRTSMGNVFNMKWAYEDKSTYIYKLHEYGYKTVALALRENCIDMEDERLNKEEKLAIILGSEGYGMSEKTIAQSDYVAKIAINPKVDSLNVATASGIALYCLCKKKENNQNLLTKE